MNLLELTASDRNKLLKPALEFSKLEISRTMKFAFDRMAKILHMMWQNVLPELGLEFRKLEMWKPNQFRLYI
jgi:hypothetical protein